MSNLWKVNDAAAYFRVSDDTIRLWARTGRIPGINIGTDQRPTWRFDPDILTKSGGIPEPPGDELSQPPAAGRIDS